MNLFKSAQRATALVGAVVIAAGLAGSALAQNPSNSGGSGDRHGNVPPAPVKAKEPKPAEATQTVVVKKHHKKRHHHHVHHAAAE